MMPLPLWLMHALLVFFIAVVVVAYIMGSSPVYGLIAVILATTSILVRHAVRKTS
jgi:hypothetical protein